MLELRAERFRTIHSFARKGVELYHKPHVHVYYGEYEASVALDGEEEYVY